MAALTFSCTVTFPVITLAAATVQGSVQGGPGQQLLFQDNAPNLIVAQSSGVSGNSSASGFANLSTGVLRSSAVATNSFPGTPYAASVVSTAIDTVRFSGGVGQTAFLDYSFDGTLGYTSPSMATFGQMLVYIGGSFANIMLSANPGNCGGGSIFADCTVATSVNKQGSIPFVITALDVNLGLNLGASLQAYSQFGNAALFSNTGRLYLRVPDGVTYTSTSGAFLTTALPILPAIPEPSSYALMTGGMGLVFLAIRRSKRVRH